jgi:Spy/CpxP family protein refolding chaperone
VRRAILVSLIVWGIVAGTAAFAVQKQPSVKTQQAAGFEEFSRKLGLTKKQQDSIKAIAAKSETDMRKLHASKESDKSKNTKMRALVVEAQSKILAVFTPEQKKKYTQMIQQAQASARPRPANAPAVSGKSPQPHPADRMTFAEAMAKKLSRLKLSSQQKAKTDAILKDFVKKHAANKKDPKLDPTKKRAKADALKGEAMKKIDAVLTPSQRAAFKKGL